MLGQRLDLFHFDEHSPGSAFWHPKGMVIWNELEAVRRRENERRGYVEVKTPLIYDKALWVTSGHWEKFRENMFLIPLDNDQVYGIKPMNCPGHMLLFGETLRSYRELPLRYAEAAPLHRNELAGALHGLTRVRHVTQDDAHIFCTQEQISGGARRLHRLSPLISTASSGSSRGPSSRRARTTSSGATRSGTSPRGSSRRRSSGTRSSSCSGAGEGSFYGPKIDLHVTDVLGRSWQLGTIQLDRQMPQRFGLTYMGAGQHRASGRSSSTGRSTDRSSGSSASSSSTSPARSRSGSRPCRCGCCRSGRAISRPRPRSSSASAPRATASTSASRTETIGKRIRASELEKIPFTIVFGDRESDESLAIRERGGEQTHEALADFLTKLATLGA